MLQHCAVVGLSILLLLGGCRAPVTIRPEDVPRVLQPGDRLRVTDAAGVETRFVLERVEEGALVGRDGSESVRVPCEDQAQVSRLELAWGRTFLLLGAVTVVLLVVAVGAAAEAVAGSAAL